MSGGNRERIRTSSKSKFYDIVLVSVSIIGLSFLLNCYHRRIGKNYYFLTCIFINFCQEWRKTDTPAECILNYFELAIKSMVYSISSKAQL